ncbi:c-type cytochrome, partial [Craterilacuibacter sp.]|uniref:c-type cytochrome n=1 Tax=Craterilacuibacter sp. TaxID=2870909 RepID=UPI003F2BDAA0
MKQRTLILCALLSTNLAFADTPAETRVKDFKTILRSFEPMGVVIRGRDPYRKDAFIKQADALKLAANAPFAHFPAGSSANSRAKANIWSEPARFNSEKNQFISRVNGLSSAAQAGDIAAIRQAYGQIAQSCKSCHDAFRAPEK